MTPLDPDIQDCKALVIDGNPTSRSTLVAMLRDWGVGTVIQTGRPGDARKALENRVFDIVLCEQHFDQAHGGGQELLDELRRAQLLPFSTVFVMVTGEASYAKVAEAAESALDSYLLKPHNAETLGERLRQARRRKRILKDIFEAVEAQDYQQAARLCMQRFAQRAEYWLYAARIGAELLLRVGDHESARKLYEAVRETNALPWAKLGIARSYVEAGDTPQAKRTLDSLISDNPGYADAYDVMGRVQIEHGDISGALETYRRACDLTPGSIGRLQKAGMLAFYAGESAEAEKCLDRAVVLGISSKMFDHQTLMLQALMKFDRGDNKALSRTVDNFKHALEKQPEDRRLLRFEGIVHTLELLMAKQLAQVVTAVKEQVGTMRDEDFDFEAAGNLMALLVRVLRNEIALPDGEIWVEKIAERFCVSRAAVDMLAGIARSVPAYEQVIRDVYARVNKMAEDAMTFTVKGHPDRAARILVDMGRDTLNAKLIELADKVIQRHHARIDNVDQLGTDCSELMMRFCGKGSKAALSDVGRTAGALALR